MVVQGEYHIGGNIELPALEVGPISQSIGNIHHVLRNAETASIDEISEVQISPRIREPLYLLSNGERIVITRRRHVSCPPGADGVLHITDFGERRWLNHQNIQTFISEVEHRGWSAISVEIANEWNGKFTFRAERPCQQDDRAVGNTGLRPPQLGALHSIGAHWSIHQTPATIVMPTGTGKTETMLATLAAYIRGAFLVVVPWDMLRDQTFRKFRTFGLLRKIGVLENQARNPIVGIVTKRPKKPDDLNIFQSCNVIVATASSLSMGEALPYAPQIAQFCHALIIDEAHHVAAANWTALKEAFGDKPILQFTATPFRRDGKLVDGHVIYSYPLRNAQRDGYFKKIVFEPIYEIDQTKADSVIATTAIAKLRSDIAAGHNHLLMARCANISRAESIHHIYQDIAPDLNPMIIHSELGDADDRVRQLREGESRIVVCVNMLGEGFDLPELKVAAVHDMHRSLAILLQFTGRFTRSAGNRIGDATVVANIADPDVSGSLERLYSEDADWNELLSELSSEAAREHAELVQFLSRSRRLDERGAGEIAISNQLLRPLMSTLIYRATEFHPQRFYEGLSKERSVQRVWIHDDSNTLYFVTRIEPRLRWTRSQELLDRAWDLFILHYNVDQQLLYLSSTDHGSAFTELASVVCGEISLITGDTIFRSLGHINRLIFQNVGVKKHGRRNLSYASYTGGDVAMALGIAERAGSIKNNLSGTGWENGERVAVGCSYKGRVWSREQNSIPEFIKWCSSVGTKLLDDTIDTNHIIANVLIPTEVNALPEKEVLCIEWPVEILGLSEDRVILTFGDNEEEEYPLFLVDIVYSAIDRETNRILFQISTDTEALAQFALTVGGVGGFNVGQTAGMSAYIAIGSKRQLLSEYLTDYPPMIRFVDLCELDGNMLIGPQQPQELVISNEVFEAWDWDDVDITKESIWKDGSERRDSIQWKVAQHFIAGGFDVVFDDDSAGEAADLVCLKEEDDCIRLALIHCKFSGGENAGERIKDVVEVCSQAVRSAKWKWRFKDLIRHLLGREDRLTNEQRPTRFLLGNAQDLNKFIKVSRFKEIYPEILIVQPGLFHANRSPDQDMVIASALTYLKETIGADMDVICGRSLN